MRARRPIDGILLETTLDERAERVRDIGSLGRDRCRGLDDMGAHQRRRGAVDEQDVVSGSMELRSHERADLASAHDDNPHQ